MSNNRVISDFKKFENMRVVSKNRMGGTWDPKNIPTDQYKNQLEASKILINKLKGRKNENLSWVRSKGYDIEVTKADNIHKGYLEGIGNMEGYAYTFYVVPSWTKESYFDLLESDYYLSKDDILEIFDYFGKDVDNLEIYGSSNIYTFFIDYKGANSDELTPEEIIGFIKSNKEIENEEERENLRIEISEVNDIDYEDCALWSAKVPIILNDYSKGSEAYNIVCELGLLFAKYELVKFMKIFKCRYHELGILDDVVFNRYTDELIEYLNLSGINITKNEDLELVRSTSYNLYKASKLFEENHDRYKKYALPKSLVNEFVKTPINTNQFKV